MSDGHDGDRLLTRPDPLESEIEALRAEVPLRPAWRALLLREIDALPVPTRERRGPRLPMPGRRTLVMTPGLALAAAVGFVLLGAAAMYVALREHTATGALAVTADQSLPRSNLAGSASVDSGASGSSATAGRAPLVTVRFMLVAPEARRVALVGDFNQWNAGAAPMRRARDGQTWTIEVGLRPGRHAYAFVVDSDVVPDPAAPSAVGEDFGVRSSVVLVSETLR
ncbi:MAG TPA: hypothetical protein VLE53_05465 [Gemmatimonadaceae bacterium]|nr:hypothetical protein [Gemmatimonadaceae bacterium]